MAGIHIGKKIKEALDRSHLTVVDFAEKINSTRGNVYDIFKRSTIDTGLLQKIAKVLGINIRDFFEENLSSVGEEHKYGYASKEEVESLARQIHILSEKIEKLSQRVVGKAQIKKIKKKITR